MACAVSHPELVVVPLQVFRVLNVQVAGALDFIEEAWHSAHKAAWSPRSLDLESLVNVSDCEIVVGNTDLNRVGVDVLGE